MPRLADRQADAEARAALELESERWQSCFFATSRCNAPAQIEAGPLLSGRRDGGIDQIGTMLSPCSGEDQRLHPASADALQAGGRDKLRKRAVSSCVPAQYAPARAIPEPAARQDK